MNPENYRQSVDSVESATHPPYKIIVEGVDRMINEGGGVVDQNFPSGALILRNDLVRPYASPDFIFNHSTLSLQNYE